MKTSKDKIEETLSYYTFKSLETLNFINSNSNLTVEEIIEKTAGRLIVEGDVPEMTF